MSPPVQRVSLAELTYANSLQGLTPKSFNVVLGRNLLTQ